MIDHLFSFADEAAAQAALSSYWIPASEDGPGTWRGDVCIPGVSVYAITGTEALTDPETGQSYDREIREPYPGWYIVVALPAIHSVLRDLPDAACRLIADRDAANRGENFIRYVAADMDPAVLSVAKVEPIFAGSSYPFGS